MDFNKWVADTALTIVLGIIALLIAIRDIDSQSAIIVGLAIAVVTLATLWFIDATLEEDWGILIRTMLWVGAMAIGGLVLLQHWLDQIL